MLSGGGGGGGGEAALCAAPIPILGASALDGGVVRLGLGAGLPRAVLPLPVLVCVFPPLSPLPALPGLRFAFRFVFRFSPAPKLGLRFPALRAVTSGGGGGGGTNANARAGTIRSCALARSPLSTVPSLPLRTSGGSPPAPTDTASPDADTLRACPCPGVGRVRTATSGGGGARGGRCVLAALGACA